jgi:hypothetical protein
MNFSNDISHSKSSNVCPIIFMRAVECSNDVIATGYCTQNAGLMISTHNLSWLLNISRAESKNNVSRVGTTQEAL